MCSEPSPGENERQDNYRNDRGLGVLSYTPQPSRELRFPGLMRAGQLLNVLFCIVVIGIQCQRLFVEF